MTSKHGHQVRERSRRGGMLVLVAVMLTVLLIMAAFAIDVAYMQLVNTQMRIATDAAARAAAGELARTQSETQARATAINTAGENPVAGDDLVLEAADIDFGRAVPNGNGTFTFSSGGAIQNAARIRGRRTADSPGGPVTLFLGGILGRDTFEPTAQSTATGIVRDIALVLDRSGSMSGQKLTDLKTAVAVFVDVLEQTYSDERVSLSSYSTSSTKDVNMTSDLSLITDAVNDYEADGNTAIGQGLQRGTDSLAFDVNSRPFSDKTIILMTDGIQNESPDVETVVPTAQMRGHTIFTVTFGEGADQTLMAQVAHQTNGQQFHAVNGAQLQQIFESIARNLAVTIIE